MYSESFQESIRKVEANRAKNAAMTPRRMTAEEKDALLKEFHPDYRENEFELLKVGPNKGDKVPHELAAMLQAHPRVCAGEVDLSKPAYDVDVLVIGGGGAGSSAAIEANENGASVMMCTKLRIGDANTMMAEGGIQAADKDNDSPERHFLDAYGGGHFAAKKELLAKLQTEGIEISTPALSLLEGQKRPVTDYELNALADVLNVSVDWLLGREPQQKYQNRKPIIGD